MSEDIIKIANITDADFDAIYKITNKPEVMQFVGNHKTWTKAQVEKYINYNNEELELDAKDRNYFSYKITLDGKLVGIIEFYRVAITQFFPHDISRKHKKDVVLRIFIDSDFHGRGIARKAIPLLSKKIAKLIPNARFLLSMVYVSNQVMNKVMPKIGFDYLTKFKFNNNFFHLYKLPISKV